MPFQTGEIGNPAGRQRAARNWATVLMQDLLAAVAAGDLTPSEAGDLADVIDVYVRARAATARLTDVRARPQQHRAANRRLWETIVGFAPLFSDCYLQ